MAALRELLSSQLTAEPTVTPKPSNAGPFRLRIVTALPGGGYSSREECVEFETARSAVAACHRLQGEYDDDCEPRRVYVIDGDGVPIKAGGV